MATVAAEVEVPATPHAVWDLYFEQSLWPAWVDQSDPNAMVPVTAAPESIHVVVTGGDSIPAAAVCPSWGHLGGFAVTKPLPETQP